MNRYEIAFSGQLVPGADLDQVKANLTRLFQADAQRIAQLFSGRRIIIKQHLDEAGAEKYRSTLERAGARAEVVQMVEVEIEEIELAPPPVAGPAAPALSRVPGPLKVAPRDEYMAAFVDVEAPDFGIAPAGADLQDQRPDAPPPPLRLDHLSVAPVGSDMGEAPRPTGGPAPDTSHLQLER